MNVSRLLIEAYRLGVFDSCWKRLLEGDSYFADCPRDEHGHCKPSGKGDGPKAAPASPGGSQSGSSQPRPRVRRKTPGVKRRINELRQKLQKDKEGRKLTKKLLRLHEKSAKQRRRVRRLQEKAVQEHEALRQARNNHGTNSPQYQQQQQRYEQAIQRVEEATQKLNRHVLTAMHVSDPAPIKISKRIKNPKLRADVQAVADYVQPLVSKKVLPKGLHLKVKVQQNRWRPEYDPFTETIYLPAEYGRQDILHEIGHQIEDFSSGANELAHDFRDHRCWGERYTNLGKRWPRRYDKNEWGRRDDFGKIWDEEWKSYYPGKYYARGETEIITTALEVLWADPARFARDDPEYFRFLTGVIGGRLT